MLRGGGGGIGARGIISKTGWMMALSGSRYFALENFFTGGGRSLDFYEPYIYPVCVFSFLFFFEGLTYTPSITSWAEAGC